MFHYRTPIAELLSGFKFNGRFEAGLAFGALLADTLSRFYVTHAATHTVPELLLPVPLHTTRLRERGYNQAAEIARPIAARCNIPISRDLVVRTRNTHPQTELGTPAARAQNLRHAFQVQDNVAAGNVKCVAIIDDVVTTMATVRALAEVLHAAGVPAIDIWCVARASR